MWYKRNTLRQKSCQHAQSLWCAGWSLRPTQTFWRFFSWLFSVVGFCKSQAPANCLEASSHKYIAHAHRMQGWLWIMLWMVVRLLFERCYMQQKQVDDEWSFFELQLKATWYGDDYAMWMRMRIQIFLWLIMMGGWCWSFWWWGGGGKLV